MTPHVLAPLVTLLAAFALLRWRAGAWRRAAWAHAPAWIIVLDASPLLLGFALFSAWSARPLLASALVFALAAGLAGADLVKREVLREPVVFADRAELVELLRHPRFYFPFVSPGLLAAGGLGSVVALGFASWIETPAWAWSAWAALAAGVVAIAAFTVPGWPPLLACLARRYGALRPSGDPGPDMARFGMLGCFVVHATLARAERPGRQAAPAVLRLRGAPRPGPVVMAQLESFFDPRRLHPAIPRDLLPHWDAACGEAIAYGRLGVPTWGANTIRTEFAALTGIGPATLGLDRFNPYERFALGRIDSIAWRMRAAGRRTICLHPFDKRFYRRHRAIPALGFERFIGPEAFPSHSRHVYVSDVDLARTAADIIVDEGENLFLFVISVGNHGPWHAEPAAGGATPTVPDALRGLPQSGAFGRYLDGLRRTDAFFAPVTDALRTNGLGTLLAYGDHQPSLPTCFAALDHTDSDTDYVVWTPDGPGAPGARRSAEALPQLLLDALARTVAPASQAYAQ